MYVVRIWASIALPASACGLLPVVGANSTQTLMFEASPVTWNVSMDST